MFRSLATSSLALIAGAAPVLAEVSPLQVWENLDRYYSDMGYEITIGSRDEAGSTLTLTDVEVATRGEAEEIVITIPKLTLQETGDAKVRTVIQGDIIADMTSHIEGEDDVTAHAQIVMPSNEMLSSGEPDDMLHQLTYPTVKITARFDEARDPDAAEMPVTVMLTDMAGEYRSRAGAGMQSTYDMTVAGLDLALAFDDLDSDDADSGSGSVNATAHIDGLAMNGMMVAPEGQFNMAEAAHEALKAGMSVEGKVQLGALTGEMRFDGVDDDGAPQSGSASLRTESSEIALTMSRDGITYGGSALGSSAELTSNDLPFPISYAIEKAAAQVAFPVSKSDEPQPFRLTYTLAGLTLADGIWNMFDPDGQLPRDPASLMIDLEGQALMREDLLDPAFGKRMSDEMAAIDEGETPAEDMPVPFQPENVTINQFALDMIGAKAELTGELTIPEGTGMPVGKVNGTFTGVNDLLEKLANMGFMPQEQLMGARMMIAMFARPAEGDPDQLTTELEFREDGSVFANGQQVK
ncbi:DUF2125 domain-containing protein [Paracoccus seriniphilus]|uniref:DUF2125 domain-containing protein n=1 Tax=Paracoccus seriniphilus TaxID=184748 RepID=A0A239PXE5_9RHOB|nr:DUF2125 domain-containing protein [Paracoccus seriniphilus]WCR14064.1 DUF2125 domain-containing protein [Paracoccus seriniphilus]SNT74964.1 hypothetical protein SAMN05444959_10945 [Paracoccus seriniphilus]